MLTEYMTVKGSEKENALACSILKICRPEKGYQFSLRVVNWEGLRTTPTEMSGQQWSVWS